MYRLMKSEKVILDHAISGHLVSYRQIEVEHFEQFGAARGACEIANRRDEPRHYVLNESGQEYYDGAWID